MCSRSCASAACARLTSNACWCRTHAPSSKGVNRTDSLLLPQSMVPRGAMTLIQIDLLAHLAEAFPDGVAWKNLGDGGELRLMDWHLRSNQLARGMRRRGVEPGDRVALSITPNEPLEWLTSY